VLSQISFWSYTIPGDPCQTRGPSSPLPHLSMTNKYALLRFAEDNTTHRLDYPTRQILITGPTQDQTTHRHCGPIKRETHKPGTPPPTTYPRNLSLSLYSNSPIEPFYSPVPTTASLSPLQSPTRAPPSPPRSPGFPPAPSLQAILTEPDAASPNLASFWKTSLGFGADFALVSSPWAARARAVSPAPVS
jgi:hypothetical protein